MTFRARVRAWVRVGFVTMVQMVHLIQSLSLCCAKRYRRGWKTETTLHTVALTAS